MCVLPTKQARTHTQQWRLGPERNQRSNSRLEAARTHHLRHDEPPRPCLTHFAPAGIDSRSFPPPSLLLAAERRWHQSRNAAGAHDRQSKPQRGPIGPKRKSRENTHPGAGGRVGRVRGGLVLDGEGRVVGSGPRGGRRGRGCPGSLCSRPTVALATWRDATRGETKLYSKKFGISRKMPLPTEFISLRCAYYYFQAFSFLCSQAITSVLAVLTSNDYILCHCFVSPLKNSVCFFALRL